MKITEIETITIQLPGRMDYSWRSLQVSIGRYVILKLTTDEGAAGSHSMKKFPASALMNLGTRG